MPSLNIKDYIIAGLSIALIGMWWSSNSLKDDLEDMTSERDKALLQVGVSDANNVSLSGVIQTQNRKIKALAVSKQKSLTELQRWKNKPEKVRYETIYKMIPADINKTEVSCEEIKNISNSLNTFDLNTL